MLSSFFSSDTKLGGPLLLLGLALTLSCTHNRPDPPNVPVGPDTVEVASAYSFKAWTVGRDFGPVHIRFDWGDGQVSPWILRGDTVSCSYSWSHTGVYRVRAQAHDYRAELSEWSEPFSVTARMPDYPYRPVGSVTVSDDILWDVLVLPGGDYVYVTDEIEGMMSVARTSGTQLAGQIPFNNGGTYAGQLVCSPDGDYVYGTSFRRDGVGVVRTRDRAIVDSLMLGGAWSSIAISPDGSRMYLVDSRSNYIVAIGLPDKVIKDTIHALGDYSYVTALRVAPDGSRLYAADQHGGGRVCAISISDDSIEWQVPVCVVEGPSGIVLNPTGSYLYALEEDKGVRVLETGASVAIDSVLLSYCRSAAISPDGSFLYVTCTDTADNYAVAVVRTSDNAGQRFIEMPDGVEAVDVAPSPDGQKLYVAADDGRLYVYGR